MTFVLYADNEAVGDLDLKAYRDDSFDNLLTGFPSDR